MNWDECGTVAFHSLRKTVDGFSMAAKTGGQMGCVVVKRDARVCRIRSDVSDCPEQDVLI